MPDINCSMRRPRRREIGAPHGLPEHGIVLERVRDGALHKVLSLAALENPGWLERAMLLVKELRGCSIGKRL